MAVFGALSTYADVIQHESGLDASGTLLCRPDLPTLCLLPYATNTAMVLCDLEDQLTGRPSEFCCRDILKRVVANALVSHSIAFNVGVEIEFCLYDASNDPVDISTFAEPVTLTQQHDYISELYDHLKLQEVEVELIHAESVPGQLELVLSYLEDPVDLIDHVLLTQETIKSVAHSHGLKALFLPKMMAHEAGNGCHFHFSIRHPKTGTNLFVGSTGNVSRQAFFDGAKENISSLGQSFIEGILKHLPSLLALSFPTQNSFRRVGKGCWTGSEATWAFDDKEASIRVVANSQVMAWEHFEYKLCDSHANLFLVLVCSLSCGMDGIAKRMDIRSPRRQQQEPRPIPTSFLNSLELLEGNEVLNQVMGDSLMKAYVAVRRSEINHGIGMSLDEELVEALRHA